MHGVEVPLNLPGCWTCWFRAISFAHSKSFGVGMWVEVGLGVDTLISRIVKRRSMVRMTSADFSQSLARIVVTWRSTELHAVLRLIASNQRDLIALRRYRSPHYRSTNFWLIVLLIRFQRTIQNRFNTKDRRESFKKAKYSLADLMASIHRRNHVLKVGGTRRWKRFNFKFAT